MPFDGIIGQFADQYDAAEMPEGTQVVSIAPSGSSYWARTAKIETIDSEGNEVSYFIKVRRGYRWASLPYLDDKLNLVNTGPPGCR